MISLNVKPGPSGSGGSALHSQLVGSLFIEECSKAIAAARKAPTEASLNAAARLIDSDKFEAWPMDEQSHLLLLYSEASFAVTGYGA